MKLQQRIHAPARPVQLDRAAGGSARWAFSEVMRATNAWRTAQAGGGPVRALTGVKSATTVGISRGLHAQCIAELRGHHRTTCLYVGYSSCRNGGDWGRAHRPVARRNSHRCWTSATIAPETRRGNDTACIIITLIRRPGGHSWGVSADEGHSSRPSQRSRPRYGSSEQTGVLGAMFAGIHLNKPLGCHLTHAWLGPGKVHASNGPSPVRGREATQHHRGRREMV